MIIRVGVIDDIAGLADTVKETVESFKGDFIDRAIEYKVTYFRDETNAFELAFSVFKNIPPPLDILFIDYNLGTGLGTDLFELIRYTSNAYKILHSITTKSDTEAENERPFFHKFSKSKTSDRIEKTLKIYERDVLSIRLYGNPSFKDCYYKNGYVLNEYSRRTAGSTTLEKVMYARSTGIKPKHVAFYYRDEINQRIEQDHTTEGLSLFDQKNLMFIKVNRSLVINMLWVANIDVVRKIVRFVPIDDTVLEVPLDSASPEFLERLSSLIPSVESLSKYYKTL